MDHAAWIARCLGRAEGAPLASEDIAALTARLREDHYGAGTTLFRTGQVPSRVHIVRRGAVELSRRLKDRKVVLQIARSGDVVGDVPVFLRMTEFSDAITLEDTVILSIDSLTLHRLLRERPRLAWRWILSVSARMASGGARVADLLGGSLEARVARVLVRQADHGIVRLGQRILAELVGGERTSVNRVLKQLEAQGLVRLRYGHVEILDDAGLAGSAGLADWVGAKRAIGRTAFTTADDALPRGA